MKTRFALAALAVLPLISGCSGLFDSQAKTDRPDRDGLSADLRQGGDAAWQGGRYAEAAGYYALAWRAETANGAAGDPELLARYAESLRRSGEAVGAALLVRDRVISGAATTGMLVTYAKSALQAGQPAASLPAAESAVARAPQDPDSRIALGLALDANGRSEDAIAAYQLALSLGAAEPASVLNNIGLAQTRLGHTEEALEALETASRMSPDNAVIRQNLAMAQHYDGYRREAGQLAEAPHPAPASAPPRTPVASAPVPPRPAVTETPAAAPSPVAQAEPATPPVRLANGGTLRLSVSHHVGFDRVTLGGGRGLGQAYALGDRVLLFLPEGADYDTALLSADLSHAVSGVTAEEMETGSRLTFILLPGAHMEENRGASGGYSLDFHGSSEPPAARLPD
jgi:Flp pilus assembly protein TadD